MTAARAVMEEDLRERLGSPQEARWMLDQVVGRRAVEVDPAGCRMLDSMVARRHRGEPLQYVLGSWAFRRLDLAVDPRALIPRPETEQVVEIALGEVAGVAVPVVVDLGTGSGAIALSLAAELAEADVWATDCDPDALALAESNRGRVAVDEPGVARVRFARGSWFEALPATLRGLVDLVVANPPYVDDGEWVDLDPEVRHEPYVALVAGSGSDGTPGFAAVESVVRGAIRWLRRGASLVVELAPPQAGAAVRLARACGYRHARIERDLSGRDRALVARR